MTELPRFRIDVVGSRDPFLIAKFKRARTANEAADWCRRWLGETEFSNCRISVTLDPDTQRTPDVKNN